MDKSAIRNFAIEARKMLMKSAETEAGFYGVTKNGCKSPIQKGNDFEVYETIAGTENRIYGADIKRRANLVKAVETLGFEQVMEETAYTWFNRIIAIRFMEVNDYLPARVRVLSSETGSNTPDIVTQSFDVDLNMTPEELEKVQEAKDENRYDDAFRMLFMKQCNELNAILPGLFEKTDDYMELLLKLSYTSDGVVRMLVDSIDENNFNVETEGQVEIIGWMYQYYNTELKAEVFGRPSGAKIRKEDIPAATQLFTPDWIVRYMVENSVGRVWIDHLRAVDPSIDEKEKAEEFRWKYYLPEAKQEDSVAEKLVEIRKDYARLEPKDITCIDPCMGSGHILVYMFDVLMDIYRSEGFSERDAVFSILENNIRGIDIDKRAYQLSYFALMMKARGYNRTFFRGKQDEEGNRRFVEPMVLAIEESNTINLGQLKYFGANLNEIEKNNAINQMQGLLEALRDAKEYGSILAVDHYDWELLLEFADSENTDGQISFDTLGIELTQSQMKRLICQGRIMSNKYCVVSTNPPYMGISNGNAKLNEFVKKNYPDSKADLFAVFIERCGQMMKKNGYQAMITQHAWMFLSSFEKLRAKLQMTDIVNMAHLGARAFEEIGGEVVQTTSFVMRKSHIAEYRGTYCRLIEPTTQKGKEEMYLAGEKRYTAVQDNFTKIPGSPVAYWVSQNLANLFEKVCVRDIATACIGMRTGDNNRFLRLWHEVFTDKIGFEYKSSLEANNAGAKWIPYNKGGEYRKWYGNHDYIVNWANDGQEIKDNTRKVYPQLKDNLGWKISNEKLYFKEGISWTVITAHPCFRRYYKGCIFSNSGQSVFSDKSENLDYLVALLNSCVVVSILEVISPTIGFESGYINKIPVIFEKKKEVISYAEKNISLARQDWDSFEISWDFSTHPFLQMNQKSIEMDEIVITKISDSYALWKAYTDIAFEKLKHNEEELNRIFIDIYGLQDELTPEVEDKDITVRKADLGRDIRSFISYAVGCMFGRYSLNQDGLMFAGGNMNDIYAYYGGTFADTANIRLDGNYTFGELGTPFYYLPVDGKEPLECWKVDADNVIPITDEEYFADDIVTRFAEFVKAVYGEETLEENLEFIADVLGNKSFSPREAIRNYFLKDFFKDHCKIYQKRPIYWLFDSGKQNGFKCLIYMHRYNKDTLNLIRSEYLHKTQNAVENALKNAEYIIQTSASAVERAKAAKDKNKYVKQLNEMRIYNQALSHLALQKIEIDLDDGVKHNYQLFQGIEVIVDGGKKQKVNLLAKI